MKEWYHKLGKRLFKVAVEQSRHTFTKGDIREAIRPLHKGVAKSGPLKGWTLNRKVDEVLGVMASIIDRRMAKPGRALPGPPLSVRLAHFRLKKLEAVKEVFARVYRAARFRKATAGNHSLEITLCKNFDEVRGSGWSERGDRYSQRCTYRRTDSYHKFTIPTDWERTVHNRGLTHARGLVLAAVKLPTSNGLVFYRAKWVEQGRGFSLEQHSGILGVSDGRVFTAEECDLCGKLTSRRCANAHRKACPEYKRQVVERAMTMGI